MRGIETVVMAGIVACFGFAIWRAPQWFPAVNSAAHGLITAASHHPAASKSSVAPKTTEVAANDKSKHGKHAQHADIRQVSSDLKADDASTMSVVWNPAFPSPSDLMAGTTRQQLTSLYGTPWLQMSAMRNGRLLERYYYSTADRSHVTVATLEDGAVVAASSISR